MNELSVEVQAREAHEKAIAYYKGTEQMFYKHIMEIKKIREERYYKQLGFDNFDDYCKTHWECERSYMNERITLADKYGDDFDGARHQFGHKKMLMLSRMEPDQRQDFIESNPVDEMTTRQLQQAIKEKKELERRLQEEQNKPARVVETIVEKVVEKVPEWLVKQADEARELKMEAFSTESKLKQLERDKAELERKLKQTVADAAEATELKRNITQLKTESESLRRELVIVEDLGRLVAQIEMLIKDKLSPIKYSRAITEMKHDPTVRRNINDIVSVVKGWCFEMDVLLDNNNIITEVDYDEQ